MTDIPKRSQITKGITVHIETKQDQGTGKLTKGTVSDILTSSEIHPHGIKVRLSDDQVGRVKKISSETANSTPDKSATKFDDLAKINIPKIEDERNEFKEFYQYDKAIEQLKLPSSEKQDSSIKNKKKMTQERLATAISAFGNKDGGFVYVGIRSDGTIAGLEKDRELEQFENYSDDFARHISDSLKTLLQDKAFILTKLHMEFREINGKIICIIQILSASEPVFLHSNRGEEFYVRGVAPGSTKLDGKDRNNYIHEHFFKKDQ